MKLKVLIPLLILFQLVVHKNMLAQDDNALTVHIVGVNTLKGMLYVYIYDKDEGFPTDVEKAYKLIKVEISKKEMNIRFTQIPFGVYAVSVYQDVNSNGELDPNFLGIPKEPTGVSNNAKGSFGPPKFDDAKFEFKKNKTIDIVL